MNTVKEHRKKSTKKVRINNLLDLPVVEKVLFHKTLVDFCLSDKRIITIPLCWIEKLSKASEIQQNNYIVRGHFVFWDDIDEIIGVKNLLDGSIVPQ